MRQSEVLVHGARAAGVCAGVAAAEVTLLEPGHHIDADGLRGLLVRAGAALDGPA